MSANAMFTRVAAPRQQQGVVLFIALIALVAMSLIGISMIRQGSSAQLIVGNLAFHEQASYGADLGVEEARKVLKNKSISDLEKDGDGYFAAGLAKDKDFKPFEYPWGGEVQLPDDGVKNQVFYIIHRLCRETGVVLSGTNLCVFDSTAADKGSTDYTRTSTDSFQPYYRITVRVQGARNAVSFSQVLVN